MDYTYSTPGQPGCVANQHILERFGIDATFEAFLAVLHLPQGSGMDTPEGQKIAATVFPAAVHCLSKLSLVISQDSESLPTRLRGNNMGTITVSD